MKKILVVVLVAMSLFFSSGVQASSSLDTALDNLYENIEIRTQNNERRADILEHMVDRLEDMYYETSNAQVRSVISQMNSKIKQQIRVYRNRGNNSDYEDASDIVDRLLGRRHHRYDDDRYNSRDDYEVDGRDYDRNYDDVETGDIKKVGELRISGSSRYHTVDIKVKVDFNGGNTDMFSRLYFRSTGGNISASSRYADSGDYRYYTFENLKVGTNYDLYAKIGGMEKRSTDVEISVYKVHGGDLGTRSIGDIEIERERHNNNPGGNYDDDDSYYDGDYMEIRSDYDRVASYNRAKKNDVVQLGQFETKKGALGTKSDMELRFETNASNFRLKNVYIVANGQKIYANGTRGTIYPNREVRFANVLSNSFYTIYGQIEYIQAEDVKLITRFYSVEYGDIIGTNIFGITHMKGRAEDSNDNSDDYDDDDSARRKLYFQTKNGITVTHFYGGYSASQKKVASFKLKGTSSRKSDIYIRYEYEDNDDKNIQARSVFVKDEDGKKYYASRVRSNRNGDVYKFSSLPGGSDYDMYAKLTGSRYEYDTVFIRFDDASNLKNTSTMRSRMIGKILLRNSYDDDDVDDEWYY